MDPSWRVAVEVRGLRDLSSTVKKAGAAVGEALERLEQVPVVGGELARPAERVQQAGGSAVESGESSRDSVHNLSLLLAIAIGVIPSVAVLGIYLHLRPAGRPACGDKAVDAGPRRGFH